MKEVFKEAEFLKEEYNYLISLNKSNLGGSIPLVVKDNICTKGLKTTAGSRILENYVPVFDASVIEKLKGKGFFVLGKTTQDAFGFGTFSTNCAFGIPKNPFDKERSCGGSSGGTAGYIQKSKYVKYGLGQSTGGSINCPACFCGVVGLTPTYGLVSRYGLIDYASSLDRIGPITKTVKDAAFLLTLIAGKDERDQTTQNNGEDYTKYCGKDVKGMKIGYIQECFEGVQDKIKENIFEALENMKKLGCKVEKVNFPLIKSLVSVYYIIAMAEASTNLAKFCGIRYGNEKDVEGVFYNNYFRDVRNNWFSEEEKRRILIGTFIRMAGYKEAYYLKSLMIKNKASAEFKKLFKKYDVLVTPTMPILPPKFSEIAKLTPLENYLMDSMTVPSSLTGLPSMSVPVKFSDGLPVGMQLISDHFKEGNIIKLGDAYERQS